ncbi:putative ABC transport system permease protein [Arcticibacter tournemirensis]|uniref:FtsX-like permease family protein n=1 Tax=Arcticibacter tournemirensis TaxID=699437 RepID=A0A5M9HGL2_9SPHI|nr:ABC transporter permease [Arcticibacter tournemirensis]KAA8484448.1 FtsX-like permease family protein [Arcticibacter tournemirensis]TQM49894.1 putative ABC transport system permease protein [Arcticibacter tournemirensis]
MIRNYLKIAFRNLWRHKGFSFINILGLAVGMTAFFLIFLYVSMELSYDNFHKKADRIYRIISDIKTPTEILKASGPSWAVPPHLKLDFPEIESFVRISNASLLVRKDNIKFQEDNSLFADSAFFQVFDFKLIKGDGRTALSNQLSIVLTETTARKYFGNSDPLGQTLLLTGDAHPAKVTGVMKDIPENSQIKADMLVSMSTLTENFNRGLDDQWGNYGASAYILLKPGTDAKALERKFPAFMERRNGKEARENKMSATLFLEPLPDVYLRSTRNGSKTGNITNVYIFSIIGIFILLIACINFINLSTARSVERAKEVGIRKVVGAAKTQLSRQFIGESLIVCLIAFVISVLLSATLRPLFNQLAGKTVSEGIFGSGSQLLILFLCSIVMGLLAGIYPALVLASFRPVSVLKGRFASGTKGILLRKGLVVAQFTISITLIIATLVVYNQMDFMRNRDLGFSKDQIMVINTNSDPARTAFKESISGLAGIKSTALSSSVPGGGNPGAYSEIENTKGEMQVANLDLYFVDFDYIPQFKIKMVAGRPFSKEFGTDTTKAMVLNEAAVRMFGYSSPQQAIGKRFRQWGREGTIVGVMKDFHYRSLQREIKPLSMRIEPNGCELISVKVSPANLPSTIAAIEKKWNAMIPGRPFSYYFLDEFFDRQYRSEEQFGKLFLNFAILAIFISCLGLLGLASYSTIQRTREIGIRKVLGANVSAIVRLLSIDFLRLVVTAFVISSPLAWLLMHQWLKDFAYKIDISWVVFAVAGSSAVLIALATISFQALKAAVANPVKSLRTE